MAVVFESESILSGVDFDALSQPKAHTLSSSSNRKLLIYVFREEHSPARTGSSIDVGAGSATIIAAADTSVHDGFREDTDLWYYDVGSGESGSINVTVNLSGASNNDGSIRIIEVSGAATGTPTLVDTDSVSVSPVSFSLTDCPADSMVVVGAVGDAGVSLGGTTYFTTPTGYTKLTEVATVPGSGSSGFCCVTQYKAITSTSTETPSIAKATDTNQEMTGVAVCIEVYSAGGGYTLSCESSAFTIAGTAATLKADRSMSAGSASYSVSASDASVEYGRTLSAASASYSVFSADAGLIADRFLQADSAAYSFNGTDATLTYTPAAGGYSLSCDSAAYSVSTASADLLKDSVLTAASASYAVAGTDAYLWYGLTLIAESAAFSVAGTDVDFSRGYNLAAESAAFVFSPTDVALTYSGVYIADPKLFFRASLGGDSYYRAHLGGDVYFKSKLH